MAGVWGLVVAWSGKHTVTAAHLVPFKTDPFDAQIGNDGNRCTYTQDENNQAGHFDCDNGSKVDCRTDDLTPQIDDSHDGPDLCSPDGIDIWYPQAFCTIGDPESTPPAPRPYREYYTGYYQRCSDDGKCLVDYFILYNDQGPHPDGIDPCTAKRFVWFSPLVDFDHLYPHGFGPFSSNLDDT